MSKDKEEIEKGKSLTTEDTENTENTEKRVNAKAQWEKKDAKKGRKGKGAARCAPTGASETVRTG